MPLKIQLIPIAGVASAPPEPEIGSSLTATYSLYNELRPAPVNYSWLAIGARPVPPTLAFSYQSDPLPVLFI